MEIEDPDDHVIKNDWVEEGEENKDDWGDSVVGVYGQHYVREVVGGLKHDEIVDGLAICGEVGLFLHRVLEENLANAPEQENVRYYKNQHGQASAEHFREHENGIAKRTKVKHAEDRSYESAQLQLQGHCHP